MKSVVKVVEGGKNTTIVGGSVAWVDVINNESVPVTTDTGVKEATSKTEGVGVSAVVDISDTKVDIITKDSDSVTIVSDKETTTVTGAIETGSITAATVAGEKGAATKGEIATVVLSDDGEVDLIVRDGTNTNVSAISQESKIVAAVEDTKSLEIGNTLEVKNLTSKTTVAAGVAAGAVVGVIAGSASPKEISSSVDDTKTVKNETSVSIIKSSDSEGIALDKIQGETVGETDVVVVAVGGEKVVSNKTVTTELSVAKVEVYEASKSNVITKVEVGQVADGSEVIVNVSKPSQQIIKQEIVYESVEHAQNETKKALTFAVAETQKKISSWYAILFSKIRSIEFSSAAAYKKEVDLIVADALKEAAVIVRESKSSIEFNYSLSESCSTDVASTVANSQKQALESLDSIYVIVTEQTSAIQEIASSADVKTIEEKITVVEEQSRRKTEKALQSTAETAICAGFEGKTITWVETAQIPASFKDVKVFAFDLVDTVVNYRATIAKAWFRLVTQKKNACTLSHIDVDALIIRWYHLYLEQRIKAKHSDNDIYVLTIALKLVLAEFSVESSFDEYELKTLASAWLQLELFEDASASIRKIKQLQGVYTVAISHAFTIRTMMDLARSGCLCWHAQFTADMFAACTVNNGTSTEVTVVSNTAMLLGLENAGQLAVVSSNPKILEAAKANGSKTVSLDRFSAGKKEHSFDIEFDGLDIFAESFETFYEAKILASTSIEVPASRSWFQRVVSTVAETAESVSHAIIG
ncbi:hypothetical protein BD408DRAFT_418083 [Parasitella parasitica]|nr:hypothetical protein BD408DRAFT_418083 [Parasitella parasitica]